ncbi:YadA-like family protein [Achromobacter deleyi]|uniref:YadA-like family protein n=1 Tax=Achromobacter deleyi TaxID=1353891 RepID=A0A7T4E0L2_9BURK|nr:YadA-like family protein [Achromobacter deleyi]QQB32468.1 YadA-like family protein [Achromobacter deleyi]
MTHSIAAAASGISLNRGAGRAGLLGRRVRALLRRVCRVLGLGRRKGLGLALLGASGAALMGATPAHAANGIHINANADSRCVSINDPQAAPPGGPTPGNYLQANVNFTDTTERCDPTRAPNQKDYVLFYRPANVPGVGATSLMLGGDLAVNSGFIKLGGEDIGMRIGDATTKAELYGLSIGNGAESSAYSASVGRQAKATGRTALAIGDKAVASGAMSAALGANASAAADRTVAVGAGAGASGDSSAAVGVDAKASGASALAVGKDAKAEGQESVAIGYGATATQDRSVALGSGSTSRAFQAPAAVVLNGKTYAFDSQDLQGVVSVGSPTLTRQIVNVAPGDVSASSKDAVNGSQLFAAYDAINALGEVDKTHQAAIDKGAADAAATRASQAAATASVAQAIGGGASVGADGAIIMPKLSLTSLGTDKTQPTTLLGAVSSLDGALQDQARALGDVTRIVGVADAKASQAERQLQGFGPDETVAGRIDEVRKNSLAWDASRDVYNAANATAGQNRISNLAAGQAETDAVNKGQLDQAITQVVAQRDGLLRESGGQLQVGAQSAATVVNLAGNAPQRDAGGNPVLGADGQPVMAATDRQVTGVAAGVNGNDAVNKVQLDGVAQTATAARDVAAQAGQAANAAGEAAAGAQRAADAAQGTASGAQQAATAARDAAAAAQRSADSANAKLAGIGDEETVAGRIDRAASAATDAAGRAASQALADALGGGATVGADGKAGAPAYAIRQVGADGSVADPAQTAANVGDALAALDANVIKVNDRVRAQDASLTQLTQDLSGLRDDSLLWDEGAQAFSASHGGASPNRVINVAEGQARTDAVNVGQLDTVAQAADAARSSADNAQRTAATARDTAVAAQADAATARDTAVAARQAAEAAQGTATDARQTAQAAQGTAADAQQTAQAAQAAATGAQRTAGAAQDTAREAQQTASAARDTADGAQRTADAAQGAASGAQQAATTARDAAAAAQRSADSANARLAGIGDGETVAGRIDQAASAATDAAGRTASQALADALGGGVTVGADGKAGAPAYAISQIGADGNVTAPGVTAANVGDAMAALDANVIKVNDRVLAQDGKLAQLTQDLSGLRDDSLLWDEGAQAFSASHGGASPNRVINVAEGQARTDAVNVGQLDTVAQAADAARSSADNAQRTAATARDTAVAAQADAATARDTAVAARQAAEAAQGTATDARQTAQAAQGTAADAQQTAQAAQAAATGAQRTAGAAQDTAREAQQTASAARDTAAGAQRTADAAQAAATGAQQTAAVASDAAAAAQRSVDSANARLAGIGEGETVAGRIDQAASAATDAAGRAASQALAAALGGGATVGADGKAGAPAYAIRQVGADGSVADPAQAAANVGDALAALDANVIKVNDRVRAQDASLTQLTQDMRDLRGDSLQWDAGAQAYSAMRGDASPNRIVNVADGQAPTDAANKGQLDTVAQAAGGARSAAEAAQQQAASAQQAATQARDTALSAQAVATDAQRSATAANARLEGIGEGETVAGRIAQAGQAASQALAASLGGGAAVRADGSLQAPAYAVTAIGPDGRVQAPAAPATSVGAAVQALDDSLVAVNDNVNRVGAQVAATRQQLDAGELGLVRQDAATRDITVARQADGSRVTLAGTDGARTLAGVKEGEISASSSEAVAGSQLFRVNQDLLANTQAVGDLEALTGRQGVTLTALSDQVRSGNVGLVRQDPSTQAVTLAADRGGSQLDLSGTAGARQVTGLQDGRIQAGSSDAVTGGQLHAVTERVNQLDAQADGVAVDSRGDGSDRAVVAPGSGGVAVGASAQAMGDRGTAVGGGAQAQAANATAVGAGASVQAAGGTAIGANATATAPGSVALGEGSQATRANTVSVGSAGNERQVTHVAAAARDTDAVNLRQATGISRQAAGQALEQANRYTDSRIGQLRTEVNAGIASAMAMAALPSASSPGKSMFAMGTSLYNGQSAIAMGLSGRSANGAWAYRASSSSTKDGDIGAAVGVGYEW